MEKKNKKKTVPNIDQYNIKEQCNQQYNTKHADNHPFFHGQDHVKFDLYYLMMTSKKKLHL